MINDAVNRGVLAGVYFPESGVSNVQTFHVDDVGLVIRALMCYVLECQRILKLFGTVSRLHCVWEKTKAAFIPGGPPPRFFGSCPGTGRKMSTQLGTSAFQWLVGFPQGC